MKALLNFPARENFVGRCIIVIRLISGPVTKVGCTFSRITNAIVVNPTKIMIPKQDL